MSSACAVDITAKEQCSGCGACAAACPAGAVSFVPDEEGFRYPQIRKDLCIGCGKCRSVCPFLSNPSCGTEKPFPQVYAAWSRDEHLRKSGSSGGIFGTFAQKVISQGGVVFGACYDDLVLKHTEVNTFGDLPKLYASKYVQSDENGTFGRVSALRKRNIPVLYCGTPCQIAGLRNLIGESGNGTILVDFVCHGVPSPEYLACYKRFLERRHNAKLLDFKMRITDGWGFGEFMTFQNETSGKKWNSMISDAALSPYLQPFFHCENYRYSCYHCPFADPRRPGDITICDFWGAESFLSYSQRNSGVSGVMINTPAGESFWNGAKDHLVFIPQSSETLMKRNESLKHPAGCPSSRKDFYHRWKCGDPEELLRSRYSSGKWKLLLLKNIARKIISRLHLSKFIHCILQR